jgi:hypothetical protein|tara:strand:- start:1975 stop:2475 length:501 start_codon:yes stop_codon:yes gene_type:complete
MITKVTIPDHRKHKLILLDLIKSIPNLSSRVKGSDNISKSDWYFNSLFPREYWDYFSKLLNPWFESMKVNYGNEHVKVMIGNYWFQQYSTNSSHEWHNHPNCNFSSVYFLELPNKDMITEFKDFKNIDAKEGDIITFPAYYLHRSKPNKTKKRKTVIVFNSSLSLI